MAAAVAREDYVEAAALKQELAALGPADAADAGRNEPRSRINTSSGRLCFSTLAPRLQLTLTL